MIFGRGGVGGVINRVTRQAERARIREGRIDLGSYGHRRLSGDVGQPFRSDAAFRANAMYENSDTYRSGVALERYGLNPTFTVSRGNSTIWRAGYEYFHDGRTADRGVPSFGGRPVSTAASTFLATQASPEQCNRQLAESSLDPSVKRTWMGTQINLAIMPSSTRTSLRFAVAQRYGRDMSEYNNEGRTTSSSRPTSW